MIIEFNIDGREGCTIGLVCYEKEALEDPNERLLFNL